MGRWLLGAVALLVAAAVWHTSDRGAARSEALRDAVLDLDSRVELRKPRDCAPSVARFEVLVAGRGPRLDGESRFVWFEAPGPDGRQQIQRVSRVTKRIECLTCAEPGNNRRPAPHPSARAVVFDTDRFASWRRPIDRELMVIAADDGPSRPSRRLTWDAAADTHALYDPSGLGIAWSRRTLAGRAVRAPIQLGHGSVSLGRSVVLARGGFAAVTPLGWSPDARSFAFAGGFSFARWAETVDFAETRARSLPEASAFDASVSFSADGAVRLHAERGDGATRAWLTREGGEPAAISLGELAGWGEPTGIALSGDADAFALAQRRAGEERIVWAELACVNAAQAE